MAYFGKVFKFEKQENFEDFMKSSGVSESDKYLTSKPSYKFTKNGDQYIFTETYDGESKDTTFKSGVEFDEDFDGQPGKCTITVVGETILYVQKMSDGTNYKSVYEFSGNKLKEIMSSSSTPIVATRLYSS